MVEREDLDTLFTATETEQVHEVAKKIAENLKNSVSLGTGAPNPEVPKNVFVTLATGLGNKKSGFQRESALIGYLHLLQITGFPTLPYVLPLLPQILELETGDKGQVVREAASAVIKEIQSLVTRSLVRPVFLDLLYQAMQTGKWPAKIGAVQFLARLAQMPVASEIISKALPAIIPEVTNCMHDTKPEVSSAAITAMNEIVKVVGNDDITNVLPDLVNCMARPLDVEACIEKLSRTTFVAEVTGPTLAVIVPLLVRALSNRSSITIRRTVVIINNLCKMVKNPREAAQFLPDLMPGLVQLVENAAFPEIRSLSNTAKETLVKVGGAGAGDISNNNGDYNVDVSMASLSLLDREEGKLVSDFITATITDRIIIADSYSENYSIALQLVIKMVAELISNRIFYKKEWTHALQVLDLKNPELAETLVTILHKHFHDLDKEKHPGDGDNGDNDDDDEGAEELCNCEFSLAYGGMLLLNHTKLRLLRGRRYGLCGHNGAGKSTLMRSIAEDKLEGFPSPEVLKTVFVEHALQGEDPTLPVVDFICADSRLAGKKDRQGIETALREVGFDDDRLSLPVSGLSGGWKAKLELARAMLLDADILLLDEPTNHMDEASVKWLENYLISKTQITCLIVSHDSGFLDNVCTDIIHYENKKLVPYRGNLSAFVKKRPEAKTYYTLSASNVKFVFPKPSSLTGVRSNTKAIVKMTGISFTYPGTTRVALQTFSGSLSLSSRVGIIGKNGAGKSTLIKVMTGEYQPTDGVVWKHPNLRIGYVAQYAFHHLEEHKEETPFQYLRWRYQGGEDREVLLKETRKFSEQDIAQMSTPIMVEGEARFIEFLFGRSKLKKSFQYEIKWKDKAHKHNTWMARDKLLELGFQKIVQAFDDHESSREGLGYRELTNSAITQHFIDVGLDPKIAENNAIRCLSGGQKVKVVIAACMWNNPHLMVLDEPTNFLDRDSLGGLAVAIRDWGGAVVMISHNDEFIKALCPEIWTVENGIVARQGKGSVESGNFEDDAAAAVVDDANIEEEIRKAQEGKQPRRKKKLTRNELKAKEARRKERKLKWLIEGGELIIDSDEEA